MVAVPADKWIPAVQPDDRTSDVAVRTLQDRLGAVLYCLPLASEQARQDVEHVHQLRVWTRRATAALRLYEDWMPRRRFAVDEKATAANPQGGQRRPRL